MSRDRLAADLATPIGLVSVFGGILAYYANAYLFTWDIVTVVFVVALALGIFGVLDTSVFIFRAFHGYKYWSLPTATELAEQDQILVSHYAPYEDGEAAAERAFEDYLKRRLVVAIDRNTFNNESRAAYLYQARRRLAATAIVTALCTAPWAVNRFSRSAPPTEVSVVTPVEVSLRAGEAMSRQPNPQQPPTQQGPAQTPSPSPQPKQPLPQAPPPPDGPPLRPIQEGEQPKKR